VDSGFPQKPDQNRAATKEAAPGKVDAGFPSSAAAAE
jgi:hypothetical protein